jgi:outer membrane protein assembly factor BamA
MIARSAALVLAVLPVLALSAQTAPTADSAASNASSVDTAPKRAKLAQLYPLPVVSSSPETGFIGGAALVRVSRRPNADANDRPSEASLTAIYTQKGQASASVGGSLWTRDNRSHLRGNLEASRFPLDFYGIGDATPDSAENYTPRTLALTAAAERRIGGAWYVGAEYSLRDVTMLEVERSRRLATHELPGSRGGRTSMLSALASYDTRDNVYYAERGGYVQLSVGESQALLGSDFGFSRFVADARRYVALQSSRPGHQARVLALQLRTEAVTGNPPFDQLALLGGGHIMRGYYEGRYRDRLMTAAQAELRAPVRGRIGMTIFAGAGNVSDDLFQLDLRNPKYSVGAGLRFALNAAEKMNIRLDYGVGRDGGAMYLTLGEAF